MLAGLVAPVDEWAAFSNKWDAVLKASPSIPYFKMSDAFALTKEFEGFTAEERDAKVDALADVILDTKVTYGVAMAMVNVDYIRIAQGATDSHLNDPFYFLFASVVSACLLHQYHEGIKEKVEFIFDASNKPTKEVEALFRQTLFTGPEKIKALNLVDKSPTFGDEKQTLPLQAADLLAGQIRSYQERGVETAVIKKLGDNNFRVAYTKYDAKLFKPLVDGTNMIQDYVRMAPPGQELARYLELKAAVENLRG